MLITIGKKFFPGHTDMALDVTEFTTAGGDILTPESDLGPKRLAVIEMLTVTKFVNDHVPSEV